jgi:membrane-associated phospholipid phosphatase
MKGFGENPWFMIPALLFLNAGLALALFVPYGDEILFLNDLRREPFNAIFQFLTLLGEFYPFVLCGVAALCLRYRYALLIALSGLVTMPTVYLIKETFAISRPITFFRNRDLGDLVVTVPGVHLNMGQTSFPSGHTMAAFALFGVLALIIGKKYRRAGLPLALLAVLVGVSRVFLVQHFLADVLAGAALGLIVSWLVWQLDKTPFFQKMHFLDRSLLMKKKEYT